MPQRNLKPEDEIQVRVIAELRLRGILCVHAANERRCSAREGARLKAKGVHAGVSDVLIFDPPPCDPTRRGAALELKVRPRKPSLAQAQFLVDLQNRGWLVAWAQGLDAALAQLRAWGYL